MIAETLIGAVVLWWLAVLPAGAVGFQTVSVPDPGNRPILVGIWYPSADRASLQMISLDTQEVAVSGAIDGHGLKLVLLSHGLGGGYASHADTALALAAAGFVAAALTHTGDDLHERSSVFLIQDRNRQLRVVADWLLLRWAGHARLDQVHIGVFGFSAGGFTALVAAGAEPDLRLVDAHCAAYPTEFTCALIEPGGAGLQPVPRGAWVHDTRIAAAVIAAPALGFAFGKPGLAHIHIPLQLWRADRDHTLPQPFYAQAVVDDLPGKADYHVVANADHLDFLSPCDRRKAYVAPAICKSGTGFDRSAFHAVFNEAVTAFFRKTLAPL